MTDLPRRVTSRALLTAALVVIVVPMAACGRGQVSTDPDIPEPSYFTTPSTAPERTLEATPRPDTPRTSEQAIPEGPSAPETTTPTRPQEADPPEGDTSRTKVPKALVGTWDGDRATISFSRSGDVTFAVKKGGTVSGTVVIDGASMTLHLSSGVVTISDWQITRFDAGYGYEFFNLTLDGTSYVRDVPK